MSKAVAFRRRILTVLPSGCNAAAAGPAKIVPERFQGNGKVFDSSIIGHGNVLSGHNWRRRHHRPAHFDYVAAYFTDARQIVSMGESVDDEHVLPAILQQQVGEHPCARYLAQELFYLFPDKAGRQFGRAEERPIGKFWIGRVINGWLQPRVLVKWPNEVLNSFQEARSENAAAFRPAERFDHSGRG